MFSPPLLTDYAPEPVADLFGQPTNARPCEVLWMEKDEKRRNDSELVLLINDYFERGRERSNKQSDSERTCSGKRLTRRDQRTGPPRRSSRPVPCSRVIPRYRAFWRQNSECPNHVRVVMRVMQCVMHHASCVTERLCRNRVADLHRSWLRAGFDDASIY